MLFDIYLSVYFHFVLFGTRKAKMNEVQKTFEERLLKQTKILKLKTFRSWHLFKQKAGKAWKEFDRQTGTSRFTKKLALAAGLKLITLAAPNATVSLHAQTSNPKIDNQTLLAKANSTVNTQPEMKEFLEEHFEEIAERQKEFTFALWENFNENIPHIQEAEKKGKATRTRELRNMFKDYKKYGISIDPRYFCAAGGMGTLFQTIEKDNFFEYEAILDCFTSPNSCTAIIKDFKKYFPKAKKTNDIQKSLADIYKKNPYAVCIAFPRSKGNSSCGYHYVTVFSNTVAVDTLVTGDDALKGKTARFNRTAISNTEDYFVNGKNRGYVFDLTEIMINYQAFQMFMDALKNKKKTQEKIKEAIDRVSVSNQQPTASLDRASEERMTRWQSVGRLQQPEQAQNLIPSYIKKGKGRLS